MCVHVQEKHFPTLFREIEPYKFDRDALKVMPRVVQSVCETIEDAYGRLAPLVFENETYTQNSSICIDAARNERHFDEKNGSTFVDAIDTQAIREAISARGKYEPTLSRTIFLVHIYCTRDL